MDLDAPSDYGKVDTEDALADVEQTAAQWREAAVLAPGALDFDGIDSVVLSGMGGSGIAGDVVWALSLEGYPRPVVVHKGHDIPGFVGPRTLVVSFSHSGSTEETLSGFVAAGERGARRFAITSGGELTRLAEEAGVDVARIPAGAQPPRHSLGFLLVPALIALGMDAGLDEAVDGIEALTTELGRSVPVADNLAKQVGQRLGAGAVALAWGGHGLGSVAAYRLKCQINENAKMPVLHAELPEAGHNEVVGWEQTSRLTGASGLVMFRDPAGEHTGVTKRFDIIDALVGESAAWTERISARGTSALARMASLLIQADLISLYAAIAADHDPSPIPSIDRLKSELSASRQ